jgi:hypothetical protein
MPPVGRKKKRKDPITGGGVVSYNPTRAQTSPVTPWFPGTPLTIQHVTVLTGPGGLPGGTGPDCGTLCPIIWGDFPPDEFTNATCWMKPTLTFYPTTRYLNATANGFQLKADNTLDNSLQLFPTYRADMPERQGCGRVVGSCGKYHGEFTAQQNVIVAPSVGDLRAEVRLTLYNLGQQNPPGSVGSVQAVFPVSPVNNFGPVVATFDFGCNLNATYTNLWFMISAMFQVTSGERFHATLDLTGWN